MHVIRQRRPELDAVVGGPTMSFNSSTVEGAVNRVKQAKAAMYDATCSRRRPRPVFGTPGSTSRVTKYVQHIVP